MTEETVESATGADAEPGPDEVYCMSCGSIIKEQAEICPECGVRQKTVDDAASTQETARQSSSEYALSEGRRHELEKVANTDTTGAVLVGFLLSPAAYLMVGRVELALLNFITFNYFLLGPFIVPLHCHKIINDAENELRRAGVEGY